MNPQSSAAISRLHLKEVLVAEQYAEIVGEHIRTLHATDTSKGETISKGALQHLNRLYGGSDDLLFHKPFIFIDGIAIIPVHGLLLNRFTEYWGFITGYNYIRAMLNAALADDAVEMIVLDVNTPGGEAAGCPELAEEIYQARAVKPIIVMIDSDAYSAGCWIMSAGTPGRVYITPSGGTGSVGVISMHVSLKGMLENVGVKVTLIFAGEHKADGNPFEDLPDDVRKEKERVLSKIYDTFVAAVARNRGIEEQTVRDTQARIFRADEALRLGFVDAIRSPAEAISARFGEVEQPEDGQDDPEEPEEEVDNMTTQTPNGGTPVITTPTAPDAGAAQPDAAALANASRAAAATERERTKTILTAPEASGKSDLANHLAFDTDLSADAAVKILAKSPSEGKAPAKSKGGSAADDGKGKDMFAAAMDDAEHPNLTPLDGEAAKPTASQRILAAQTKLHGEPPKPKATQH